MADDGTKKGCWIRDEEIAKHLQIYNDVLFATKNCVGFCHQKLIILASNFFFGTRNNFELNGYPFSNTIR